MFLRVSWRASSQYLMRHFAVITVVVVCNEEEKALRKTVHLRTKCPLKCFFFLAVAFIEINVSDKKKWDTCKDILPGFMSPAWAGRKPLSHVFVWLFSFFKFQIETFSVSLLSPSGNSNFSWWKKHSSMNPWQVTSSSNSRTRHCAATQWAASLFFCYCCFHKKSSNLQQVNTSDVTMLQGRCCVVVLLLLFCV